MSMRSRRGIIGFSSAAMALVLASVAWACTAVPSCAGGPGSGPAGTRVSVNCIGFEQKTPVEIRWDSAEGPLVGNSVASDRDGSFAVTFTPPLDAPADVHYLVAVQRAHDGSILAKASTTFELTTSAASRASTRTVLNDNWSGFSSGATASDNVTSPVGSESESNALGIGMALLAVGMGFIVLSAGLAVRTGRKSPSRF